MKKIVLGVILAFIGSITLNAQNFEGIYKVKGFDPYEKKSYAGTVEITKDDNDVYRAQWTLDLDPPNYTGTGLKNRDQLIFVYQSSTPRPGGKVGLQIYTIKKNKLEGNFVYYDGSLVGTEILTKQ